jgi:hypothetical protein
MVVPGSANPIGGQGFFNTRWNGNKRASWFENGFGRKSKESL